MRRSLKILTALFIFIVLCDVAIYVIKLTDKRGCSPRDDSCAVGCP